MSIFVGIDVSKAMLDLAVLDGTSQSFSNDESGWEAIFELLQPLKPGCVVLEATGGYEKGVFRILVAAGLPVIRVKCESLLARLVSWPRPTSLTPNPSALCTRD